MSVFATDSLGCSSAPINLPVTINALPAADAGPDQPICQGDSVAIGGAPTGPPGSTFNWSNSGSLSSGSAANPFASPTTTTTYVVTVANAGCVATDTVVVNISNVAVSAGPDAVIRSG